jgi:hypothetical protein
MLGQVIFIREERPDAPELQDTLASVHDCQFIPAHQLTATLSSDEFRFHIFLLTILQVPLSVFPRRYVHRYTRTLIFAKSLDKTPFAAIL